MQAPCSRTLVGAVHTAGLGMYTARVVISALLEVSLCEVRVLFPVPGEGEERRRRGLLGHPEEV